MSDQSPTAFRRATHTYSVVTNLAPRRIGLIGFEGVSGLHLTGPADIFAATALDDGYGGRIPCYDICLLGLTGAPFRTESGIAFRPQKTLRSAPDFDTIIVPGGRGMSDPAVSGSSGWMVKTPRPRHSSHRCPTNGVYSFARSGLLDGRAVTTHWRFARDLARRFPTLRVDHKKPIVWDGPFGTASGGLTAGIELSRQIVAEDFGPQMLLYSGTGVGPRFRAAERAMRQGKSPAYFSDQSSDRFAEFVAWMLRNLDEDLSVPALARRACMCRDSFSRAFKGVFGTTPASFVENLRLQEARRRLSTSRRMLHSVARSVGFRDPTTFGKAFERRFGVRPTALPAVRGDK